MGLGPAATSLEKESLRAAARELGFLQVGFARSDRPNRAEEYLAWLRDGHHGEMAWLAREDAVKRRLDPAEALPGCRTVIMVSLSYAPDALQLPSPKSVQPQIARYAHGRDYHLVLEDRLERLVSEVRRRWPGAGARAYVDYGPVLEREHAQRAGLGWIGKNTMLIHPEHGSWTLLGEVLTTVAIDPDPPFEADRCGTCVRCIDACPTGAITAPRHLDSRLCISYLTIELRGSIPEALRPAIGNRVFGCDICQEVCPWNDGVPAGDLAQLATRWGGPVPPETMLSWAEEILDLSDEQFRAAYGQTALARPGRDGWLRNLCVGLGNAGDTRAVPVIMRCFDEESPVVREHAAWALGRLAGADARA